MSEYFGIIFMGGTAFGIMLGINIASFMNYLRGLEFKIKEMEKKK